MVFWLNVESFFQCLFFFFFFLLYVNRVGLLVLLSYLSVGFIILRRVYAYNFFNFGFVSCLLIDKQLSQERPVPHDDNDSAEHRRTDTNLQGDQ